MSVVLTCYLQGRFVTEALDSVAAQTFTDWELLIVDDGSPDGTPDVVRAWLERTGVSATFVVHEENRGLTTTLNASLPRCRGRYLAHLGGDDRWHPDTLAHLVVALEAADGETFAAYGDGRTMDVDGHVLSESFLKEQGFVPPPEGRVFETLLRGNFVLACAILFRRSAIDAVGGWDEELPFEDWDMLLAQADRGTLVHVPAIVADYRIHADSMTRSRFSDMLVGRMQLLEKWRGRDPAHDEVIVPYLRFQSWRVFKVHPDKGRDRVAVAYRSGGGPRGRLRYLVATRPWAERAFEALRRVRRRLRRG